MTRPLRRLGPLLALTLAAPGACVEAQPSGALDDTFINGPRASVGFTPVAMTTEPSGTVYVLGTAQNCASSTSGQDFAIVHYLIDGTLDVSYGDMGEVCVDFATSNESPRWIGVDGEGRVVVAGGAASQGALARVTTTGDLDEGFGDGGALLLPDTGVYVSSVAIVDSGLVVAVVPEAGGSTATLLPLSEVGAPIGPRTDIPAQAIAPVALAVSNGDVLAAQSASASPGARAGFAVTRATLAGRVASFGSGGTAYASVAPTGVDVAEAVAVQSGGEIVVAGPVAVADTGQASFDVGVVRFTPDGQPDAIAVAGPSVSGIPRLGDVQWSVGRGGAGLALQSGDRILIGGSAASDDPKGGRDAVVQRLTPDLRVDTTFGTNGVWSSNVTGDDDVIAVTVDFAGKVVVLATNGPDSYALYRLNP